MGVTLYHCPRCAQPEPFRSCVSTRCASCGDELTLEEIECELCFSCRLQQTNTLGGVFGIRRTRLTGAVRCFF
jgi:hypothetical protein